MKLKKQINHKKKQTHIRGLRLVLRQFKKISLLSFIILTCNASYFQAESRDNIVEIPNDDLPWLRGNANNQPSTRPNTSNIPNPQSEIVTSSTATIKADIEAQKNELKQNALDAELVETPANTHGFVVDRLLEHNYVQQDYALLKILDKVTAKTSTVEAKVDIPFQFGWIEVVVKTAKKTPPEEEPEATAYIEVFSKYPKKQSEKIFSGFLFASSPSISAIEHPRYDIRLSDCTTDAEKQKIAEEALKKAEALQKAEEEKKANQGKKADQSKQTKPNSKGKTSASLISTQQEKQETNQNDSD